MEMAGRVGGSVRALLLDAGRNRPVRPCGLRGIGIDKMVCARTCAALPDSGSLHCRSDRSIRKSGRGNALSRTESEKGDGLRGSFRFRLHSGGLFLYDSAAFRRNLQTRGGTRSGGGISLFRPGNQHHGNRVDCADSRAGAWHRPRRRSNRHEYCDRRLHALAVPQRRTGESRCRR